MILRALVPALLATLAGAADDALLWRIASPSGGGAGGAIPAGTVQADGGLAPKTMRGSQNPVTEIRFTLAQVPAHGVEFSFHLRNSEKSGAQMGVFANGQMAGLVQLWGTAGSASPWRWQKTYRVYIPPTQLAAGANVLRLATVRPIWSDQGADARIWWEWDDLRLTALGQRPREAMHGSVAYLGTTFKHSDHDFIVNADTARFAAAALPWMGVAWSGNTMRGDFWYDVSGSQPGRKALLAQLRDLNCTAMVDNVSGGHWRPDADGRMPQKVQDDLRAFFADLGPLFQWYELGNEPCMFGGGLPEYLETARVVNALRPAWVKLTAPGWAYGGGKGTPVNWDAVAQNRRAVEALCQATNGHSYGYSYGDDTGGSFIENLATYRGVEDGWPKEYVNSETGTNNWHSEENGPRLPSSQPKIQAFDRIMRAHVAVVDRTMQHAAIFGDFGLFKSADFADLDRLAAFPAPDGDGKETRIAAYRRLACAYATHGAPLPASVANRDELQHRLVYVRAVDTAAIPGQRGSNATSTRVLVNLVNFEAAPATVRVAVTLPAAGAWAGERYGAGDTLATARRAVNFDAKPVVELSEQLAPGEAVQYILTPPVAAVPWAPTAVVATPAEGGVALAWAASAGAASYTVWRAEAGGTAVAVARDVAQPAWIDAAAKPGASYAYAVSAANPAGESPRSASAGIVAGTPAAPLGLAATAGDGQVRLTWNPVAGATGYAVERAPAASGPWQALAAPDAAECTASALANGAQLWFRVAARNPVGTGAPGEPIACTPAAPPAATQAPALTVGDGIVALRWAAVPGADAYQVLRNGSVIARELASGEYIDIHAPGAPSRYSVVALAQGVAGAPSPEVEATPAASALPAPWKHAAIGAESPVGAASAHPSGTFTVRGAGGDLWGKADGLHLAYVPLPGDGALTCRVASMEDTHEWARVGVMVRSSLAADAAMAIACLTPAKGSGFVHRDAVGGECQNAGTHAMPWLRLERKGDLVTGSASADGTAWTKLGEARLPLGADAVIGLAVCSHRGATLNTALFDQVAFSPARAP